MADAAEAGAKPSTWTHGLEVIIFALEAKVMTRSLMMVAASSLGEAWSGDPSLRTLSSVDRTRACSARTFAHIQHPLRNR